LFDQSIDERLGDVGLGMTVFDGGAAYQQDEGRLDQMLRDSHR
jgi:hypothetical protein